MSRLQFLAATKARIADEMKSLCITSECIFQDLIDMDEDKYLSFSDKQKLCYDEDDEDAKLPLTQKDLMNCYESMSYVRAAVHELHDSAQWAREQALERKSVLDVAIELSVPEEEARTVVYKRKAEAVKQREADRRARMEVVQLAAQKKVSTLEALRMIHQRKSKRSREEPKDGAADKPVEVEDDDQPQSKRARVDE